MALYHFQIGFPKGFNSNVGKVRAQYTRHAYEAALTDRYGRIVLPRMVDTQDAQCVEVELDGGRVSKLVYRIAYSKNYDLVLVCIPVQGHFLVKTVWLNKRRDQHLTLDASRYSVPA